jgi:hypothetical protein
VDQEIGSIIGFCYKQLPIQMYTDRLPQNFTYPCFYFPPPITVDGPDTVSTYLKNYTLPIKLFWGDMKSRAMDSRRALTEADRIADIIREGRFLIPLLNQDGTVDQGFIRIKRCQTRPLDDGVALLTLNWNSRYLFHKDTYEKMRHFYLDQYVKE